MSLKSFDFKPKIDQKSRKIAEKSNTRVKVEELYKNQMQGT